MATTIYSQVFNIPRVTAVNDISLQKKLSNNLDNCWQCQLSLVVTEEAGREYHLYNNYTCQVYGKQVSSSVGLYESEKKIKIQNKNLTIDNKPIFFNYNSTSDMPIYPINDSIVELNEYSWQPFYFTAVNTIPIQQRGQIFYINGGFEIYNSPFQITASCPIENFSMTRFFSWVQAQHQQSSELTQFIWKNGQEMEIIANRGTDYSWQVKFKSFGSQIFSIDLTDIATLGLYVLDASQGSTITIKRDNTSMQNIITADDIFYSESVQALNTQPKTIEQPNFVYPYVTSYPVRSDIKAIDGFADFLPVSDSTGEVEYIADMEIIESRPNDFSQTAIFKKLQPYAQFLKIGEDEQNPAENIIWWYQFEGDATERIYINDYLVYADERPPAGKAPPPFLEMDYLGAWKKNPAWIDDSLSGRCWQNNFIKFNLYYEDLSLNLPDFSCVFTGEKASYYRANIFPSSLPISNLQEIYNNTTNQWELPQYAKQEFKQITNDIYGGETLNIKPYTNAFSGLGNSYWYVEFAIDNPNSQLSLRDMKPNFKTLNFGYEAGYLPSVEWTLNGTPWNFQDISSASYSQINLIGNYVKLSETGLKFYNITLYADKTKQNILATTGNVYSTRINFVYNVLANIDTQNYYIEALIVNQNDLQTLYSATITNAPYITDSVIEFIAESDNDKNAIKLSYEISGATNPLANMIVFRKPHNSNVFNKIGEISLENKTDNILYDYDANNNMAYDYMLVGYNSSETHYSAEVEVETKWEGFTLYPLQFNQNTKIYEFVPNEDNIPQQWTFLLNTQEGDFSLVQDKTFQDTFTEYPIVSVGRRNYYTGSLSCLLGNILCNTNNNMVYYDSYQLVQQWERTIKDFSAFLYKNYKGDVYVIAIQDNSSKKYQNEISNYRDISINSTIEYSSYPTNISFNFTEIQNKNKLNLIWG